MPTVLAASTMSVPAGTVILWPSIVRLMSGMRESLPDVAFVTQAVVLVLVGEVRHGRLDGPAGRVTKAAEAASVLQPVGNPLENAELELRAFVREDAVVCAHRPVAADAARRALAARLKGVEAQQPGGRLDDAVRVVHHDDAARPAHRPERLETIEVGRGVQHRGGEDFGGRPARPEHFQLASGQHAAREPFDDVAVCDADHYLEVAGFLNVAADGHHARSLRLLGAAARVLGAAVADGPAHRRERLDGVDRGRQPPRTLDGGKWGTGARLGPLALERLEQCGLLAADVGAVASIQ